MLSIDDKSIISCLAVISISLIVYIYTRTVKAGEEKTDDIKKGLESINEKQRNQEIKILEIEVSKKAIEEIKKAIEEIKKEIVLINSNQASLNVKIESTTHNSFARTFTNSLCNNMFDELEKSNATLLNSIIDKTTKSLRHEK